MKWIKVNKDRPNLHTRVLVYVNNRIEIAFYDIGSNGVEYFWDVPELSFYGKVTHWAPLPSSPSE